MNVFFLCTPESGTTAPSRLIVVIFVTRRRSYESVHTCDHWALMSPEPSIYSTIMTFQWRFKHTDDSSFLCHYCRAQCHTSVINTRLQYGIDLPCSMCGTNGRPWESAGLKSQPDSTALVRMSGWHFKLAKVSAPLTFLSTFYYIVSWDDTEEMIRCKVVCVQLVSRCKFPVPLK